MSDNTKIQKNRIAKFKIVDRFYIEAFTSNYAPNGMLRLYRVTRNFPQSRDLPFIYQSARIKNPEELAKVKPVLDYLAGKLGWQQLPPLLKDLEEQLRKQEAIDPEILRIVQQYPRVSIGMLKAFDTLFLDQVELDDVPLLGEYVKTALNSVLGKQEIMIKSQLDLIDRLGEEKTPEGIQRLLKLLQEYDLPQITSVTSIITDRLQKLKVFERAIQNERAYEIKGKNSIHSQLVNALWILDDSYWLLHANEPLSNFLKKKYDSASRDERLKPDFICANDKSTLVIVEIKRPSHEIREEDIRQLHNYVIAVDEYYPNGFADKMGFIIGKRISPHNQKIIDDIECIQFKSYTKLVDDCKYRYQEYLNVIEKMK